MVYDGVNCNWLLIRTKHSMVQFANTILRYWSSNFQKQLDGKYNYERRLASVVGSDLRINKDELGFPSSIYSIYTQYDSFILSLDY